ncbi:hypothetical protein M0R45_032737 [Rubus argutus]|uniref:Pentatricopeptide repeat-containing protein n=1 Tax=Rubus argutus TaxID=59490 RepID=A0AAW1WI06_RUBAR
MLNPLKTPTLLHLQTLQSLLGPHHFLKFSSRTKLLTQFCHSSSNPFPNLVSIICDILGDPRWEKSPELEGLILKLRPYHVLKIIETHRNTDSALRFFFWVSRRRPYKHDMSCFVSMLDRLVHERLFGPADHVRLLLIKACRNEEELKWFEMVSVAQNVYSEILNSGIKPSLLTFNTMINILCKKGKVQEAELILSTIIIQYDMLPDVFTYTSLVLGHCRNGNLKLAFEVYDRMVKAGCDPNSVTYSTLINGLCNEGRVDEALDMLDEMIEKGIEPTVYTYTVPITSLCEANRPLEAIGLFRSMRKTGCYPNIHTYTALISGLSRTGKLKIAIGLYHKLLKDGMVPSTVTFNTIINELIEAGRYDMGLKIIYWMERHDYCISENIRTHNHIIKGLCLMGKIHKAMALLSKMLKVGPCPNVITYNTLINGYLNRGNVNNALRLLDLIDEREWM